MGTIPAQTGIQTLGSNIASATPSSSTPGTLVSSATNATGIIITSFSAKGNDSNSGLMTLNLTVNGSVIMTFGTQIGSSQSNAFATGNFCAIKIPAGQDVAYTCSGMVGGVLRITWAAA